MVRFVANRLLASRTSDGGQPGARPFQPVFADGGQFLAAFPEFERLLKGQATGFKALDQFDKLITGLLIAERLA